MKKDTKFKKGNKRSVGKGRPKGAESKKTRDIRHMQNTLLACITDEDLMDLVTVLKREKPETLLAYLAKIAPKELAIKTEQPDIIGKITLFKRGLSN